MSNARVIDELLPDWNVKKVQEKRVLGVKEDELLPDWNVKKSLAKSTTAPMRMSY